MDRTFLEEFAAIRAHLHVDVWLGKYDLPLAAADRCVALLRRFFREAQEPTQVRWRSSA